MEKKITIKKYKPFKGGYEFKRFHIKPIIDLTEVKTPAKIIIRLRQGFGNYVTPIVKIGQKVNAGEIIATDGKSLSTPIHSSCAGIIENFITTSHGKNTVEAIVISTIADKNEKVCKIERPDANPLTYSSAQIGKILYEAGVTSIGRSGIPTKHHSSVIEPDSVIEIVVSALKTEPFLFPFEFLFEKFPQKIILGLKAVKSLFPRARLNITLHKEDLSQFLSMLKVNNFHEEITIHLLSRKYPQEQQDILLKQIFNLNLPAGKDAVNLGVLLLNTDELLPIYDAVFEGKPLIERLIFVSGSGCADLDFVYKVKVGTPLNQFVRVCVEEPSRMILGSVLSGREIEFLEESTSKSTSSLAVLLRGEKREFLSFLRPGSDRDSFTNTFLSKFAVNTVKKSSTNLQGEKRPCVLCNFCERVCPAGIIPHLLYKLIEKNLLEEVLKFRLIDCVNCGLCTYVCPSKIEIDKSLQKTKEQVLG